MNHKIPASIIATALLCLFLLPALALANDTERDTAIELTPGQLMQADSSAALSAQDASTANAYMLSNTSTGKCYWTTDFNETIRLCQDGDYRYIRTDSYQEMFRLYNPNSGEHFYTAAIDERDHLVDVGWNYEGIGWVAPTSGNPVYRLYNPNAGDHHYTMDIFEKDWLVVVGWNYEGIGWWSDSSKTKPLYRQYNPNAATGTHNYTVDKAENDYLVSLGWRGENIGWYGLDANTTASAETYKPKYSYELYLINSPASETYTDFEKPAYLKTNNPNPDTIAILGNSGKPVIGRGDTYDDIDYSSNDASSMLRKVDGGYVLNLDFSEAGQQSLEIVEKSDTNGIFASDGRYSYTLNRSGVLTVPDQDCDKVYAVASTASLNVLSWSDSERQWMNGVIAHATDASMTPPQKMTAICSYLRNEEKFKYSLVDNPYTHYLSIAQQRGPYFRTKRWNSYSSPAKLCEFANLIGGFEDVHNCYGDYPMGTSQWGSTHYYCRVTYQGQDYYYEACPDSGTGLISYTSIDFKDSSKLTKISR